MILYNLRYRGPFEYDKLILNTLQYCNDVKKIAIEYNDLPIKNTFFDTENKITTILNTLSGENAPLVNILKIKMAGNL